jgi:ornithine cyclodeaminase/alanine dehydrogenase-like protein (mu-crystallin family)
MTRVPIFLSEQDVQRLLDRGSVLRIVEDTLKAISAGQVVTGAKCDLLIDDLDGQRFMGANMACIKPRRVAGVKLFTTCDGNRDRGLPRVPATIVACDSITGVLAGVVEATLLTAVRTAALATAALRPCISQRPRKAAVIGYGAIGRVGARYLRDEFGVERISVTGRDAGRAIAKSSSPADDLQVRVEERVEQAVKDADIIITALGLSKDAPIVKNDWIKPDATICALGSHQEIESSTILSADRIFVDNWEASKHRGNLAPLISRGEIARDNITGEVAELVAGRCAGRRSTGDRIVIVLVGLVALDIALAAQALELARERHVGLNLSQAAREHL